MAGKIVAILGTLDTKATEFAFLKRAIEGEGVGTLLIDAGVLADPPFAPDITAHEVATAKNRRQATKVINAVLEYVRRLMADGPWQQPAEPAVAAVPVP